LHLSLSPVALLEVLALRQQLVVLKAKHLQPRVALPDRLFWVVLRQLWPGWKRALVLVAAGDGRRLASSRIQDVLEVALVASGIVRAESPSARNCANSSSVWLPRTRPGGGPRIHGELKMLGFDISERTVLRWMRKAPRSLESAKRRAAFLSNHREAIAAMDFFTVLTLTFGMLHCFFVIVHDRRRILLCNVTRHPTSAQGKSLL
jgi:hypothetical protein